MKTKKNWLVAGGSHGLGLAAVKYLLSRNQTVIALVADDINFNSELVANPQLEIINLNLTSETEVVQICQNIAAKYGLIDKLVNNAAITEVAIRHLLPIMQRNGHIIDLLQSCEPLSIANSTRRLATQYVNCLSEEVYLQASKLGIRISIIKQESPVLSFSNN